MNRLSNFWKYDSDRVLRFLLFIPAAVITLTMAEVVWNSEEKFEEYLINNDYGELLHLISTPFVIVFLVLISMAGALTQKTVKEEISNGLGMTIVIIFFSTVSVIFYFNLILDDLYPDSWWYRSFYLFLFGSGLVHSKYN